jgi:acetolactate decarboxylase
VGFGALSGAYGLNGTLFQVAPYSAPLHGDFAGDYKFGQLVKHGDFGIGTFNDLDGELIAVDGKFYQYLSDGKLHPIKANQLMPWAAVQYFKPTIHKNLDNVANFKDLTGILSKTCPNPNTPCAIRIDGNFSIKYRIVRKQHKPYPPGSEVLKGQVVIERQNVKGTMVGYWSPQYWSVFMAPVHLHFVTADRSSGGHVLEVNVINGKLSAQPINEVQMYLPNTKSFSEVKM